MKIWKVEGYGKFYEQKTMVLGKNFEDAKQVVAEHYGLQIDEVGKCFTIEYYATI